MDIKDLQARTAEFKDRLSRGPVSDALFSETFNSLLEIASGLSVWVSMAVSDKASTALCTYEVANPFSRPVDAKNIEQRAARLLQRHSRGPSCEIGTDEVDDFVRKLGELVILHWADRDQGTMLPRLQDAGMPDRVLQSVQDMVRHGSFLAVLHADLDKFKLVNSEFGEPNGNIVIRAFSDRLRDAFADLGLVVRTGGEEFSAFLVDDDPIVFMERAESFRLRMQNEPLPAIDRPNTCSIGLAIFATAELPANLGSIDDVLSAARQAETRAKEDGRNKIRLPKAGGGTDGTNSTTTLDDLRRSALTSRAALFSDDPVVFETFFARAIARLLTQKLSDPNLALSSISELIESCATAIDVMPVAASWSALQQSSGGSAEGWPQPVTPFMPTPVWGAIVARALLSATYRNGGPLTPHDVLEFRLTSAEGNFENVAPAKLWLDIHRLDTTIVAIPLGPVMFEGSSVAKIKIGQPWYSVGVEIAGALHRVRVENEDGFSVSHEPLSPCLLMPIGDAAILEAKTIGGFVAGFVEVDDRPVQGGGLPDFWQSNLARIVRACLRNPNISTIIAVGEEEGASQTISRLKLSTEAWNEKLPDLQRRLSIGADHLGAFRKRDIQFQLVASGKGELLDAVVACTASDNLGDPRNSPTVDLDREMVRRRLAVPPATDSNQLSINDGLRCRTLADAYPLAIQLLRSSNAPPQTEPNRRTFREFPCFKLVLTQAFQDEVPDYWLKEQESIEEYVRQNFTSSEGLFGKRLATSGGETEVRDYGVNAVVSAVKDRRPTRRIMLPVATINELNQPLGLSMIQVLPRERDGKWYLDFQWIWRTVEVLVGFPFSAIGSIRWSEEFFKSVKERLDAEGHVDRLELGQLTYVALSFHMFLDIGDKEIARAIVHDATR